MAAAASSKKITEATQSLEAKNQNLHCVTSSKLFVSQSLSLDQPRYKGWGN